MIRIILAAAFAVATLYVAMMPAHAAPGDDAKHSARYAAFIANCTDDGMRTSAKRDEAARKLEAMSAEDFQKQIDPCLEQEAAKNPPQAALQRQASMFKRRPPPQYRGEQDENEDYASVLRAYKGPLWKPQGIHAKHHMNERPPENAVPCKPPGFDHVILCSPNPRR